MAWGDSCHSRLIAQLHCWLVVKPEYISLPVSNLTFTWVPLMKFFLKFPEKQDASIGRLQIVSISYHQVLPLPPSLSFTSFEVCCIRLLTLSLWGLLWFISLLDKSCIFLMTSLPGYITFYLLKNLLLFLGISISLLMSAPRLHLSF